MQATIGTWRTWGDKAELIFRTSFFLWNQSWVEAWRARAVFFFWARRGSSCLLFLCRRRTAHTSPGGVVARVGGVTDSPGLCQNRSTVHVAPRPGALFARNEVVTCVKHQSNTKIVPLILIIIKLIPYQLLHLLSDSTEIITARFWHRPSQTRPKFFFPAYGAFLFKVCLWSGNKKNKNNI